MIYLDNGATSLHKPARVAQRMLYALRNCANPGRGGYVHAERAARLVYRCREEAAKLFSCRSDQVVLTPGCTYGLNMAIRTLLKPGDRVLISGFEHNAVTRPLHALDAEIIVAGRRLFDREDTLSAFEDGLRRGVKAAIFTHVSNVFGYILPIEEMAKLCRERGIPFVIDAAQSAGTLPVSLQELGAAFIAVPGHKGLMGPQGTGLLLCGETPLPLIQGGTGTESARQRPMPCLPECAEAGTINVPGIAGLSAALEYLNQKGIPELARREHKQTLRCVRGLQRLGVSVFSGEGQASTVSFVPPGDCEELAMKLAENGVAVRAGLHCAPLAHESAGTLQSGTVRVSFGMDASDEQTDRFLSILSKILNRKESVVM